MSDYRRGYELVILFIEHLQNSNYSFIAHYSTH
jgi:hypothetical protein